MTENVKQLVKKELAEAIVKNPKILYEQVLGQMIHTGTLTFDRRLPEKDSGIVTVPFVLTDDFTFGLGNNWGTAAPETFTQIFDNFLGATNSLTTLTDNPNDIEMTYKNKVMGRAVYKGSNTPEFTVNLMFVCTQRSMDPSKIMMNIASMCLPTEVSAETFMNSTAGKALTGVADGIKSFFPNLSKLGSEAVTKTNEAMHQSDNFFVKALDKTLDIATSQGALYAPLGYKTGWDNEKSQNKKLTSQGTITLQIGRWFKAEQLVCNSMSNIRFSKETIAPPPEWLAQHSGSSVYTTTKDSDKWGFPLYATCSLTLRPVTYITYADFMQYFILPNSNATKINPLAQIGNIQNQSGILKDAIKDATNVNNF